MPVQRRTHAQRRHETEHALISAALRIAATNGFSAITCEAVGLEAGLSRGLTHQRFGSKEGLLLACLQYLEGYRARLMAEAGLDNLKGADTVLAYIDLHLSALPASVEAPAYFVMLSGALSDMPSLKAAFDSASNRSIKEISSFIRRGQDDGSISGHLDARQAAEMIFTLMTGLGIQWLLAPSKTKLRRIRLEAHQFVLARLLPMH